MTKSELDSLVRCGFSHNQIAERIFNQFSFPIAPDSSPLTHDEHSFLLEHLTSWTSGFLDAWLACHPKTDSPRILQEFLSRVREENSFWLSPPEGWSDLDFEEMIDLWRRVEPEGRWRRWLPQLRGLCPLFHALVSLEAAPARPLFSLESSLLQFGIDAPLAVCLWDLRRDAAGLAAGLVALARSAQPPSAGLPPLAPTLPAPAIPEGSAAHLYVLTCMERLGLLEGVEPRSILPSSTAWPKYLPNGLRARVPKAPAKTTPEPQGEAQGVAQDASLRTWLPEDEARGDWVRRLALRWPGGRARSWLRDEALRAVAAGVPWGVVWALTEDKEMRISLGIAAASGPGNAPALFSGWALAEGIRPDKPFDWTSAFRWIEAARAPGWLHSEQVERPEFFSYPDPFVLSDERTSSVRPELSVFPNLQRILFEAPWPTDTDAQFVERFLEAADLLRGPSTTGLEYWPRELLARLLDLPIPAKQARAILLGVLRYGPEVDMTMLGRLVALAGTLAPDEFPPEELNWMPQDADLVVAYRTIVGSSADPALKGWMCREMGALRLLEGHPELLDDEVRGRMRAWALESFSSARWVAQLVPGLLDEQDMETAALRSAQGGEWRFEFQHYPPACREPLLERFSEALSHHDDKLIEALAGWLEKHGVDEAELIGLWLARVGGDVNRVALGRSGGLRWCSRRLSTGASWARHGQDIVRKALDVDRPDLLLDLGYELTRMASKAKPEWHAPIAAMHEALARVLIERTEGALQRQDPPGEEAERLLRALFFLNPRSGLSGPFSKVRRLGGEGALGELLRVCGGHLRRNNRKEATLGDLGMAVSELAPRQAGGTALGEGTSA